MPELQKVRFLANAAVDKKAYDVVILDVQDISAFTDYFMICHGNTERQVQAIAHHLKGQQHDGLEVRGVEGEREGRWVLLDMYDIVIHVFHKDLRDFYGLERLWGDAKRVELA